MAAMEVVEAVALPLFPNGVPQNAAMRTYKNQFPVGTFGSAGQSMNVMGETVMRTMGSDEKAAAVGSRAIKEGIATFTFKIERTRGNDGLGLFVGVADAAIDFQNRTEWGAAYAMGCHGRNLFSWDDALGSASLVRNALEGSEDSVMDGSVIRVRVDMDKRELAFAVDSADFEVARGVTLPAIVRPFCKLAGFAGDKVSMAYDGEEAKVTTQMVPPPLFAYGVPQSKAMLAHGIHYPRFVLGPHGENVRLSEQSAIRAGGADASAAVVGARGTVSGTATYTFRIDRTKGNDGLGVFVGVADASTDFQNAQGWGAAWALGCHGGNLFSFDDALAAGSLLRDSLPGAEESLLDGSVVKVRVDMDARPRTLAFSVDDGAFVSAKGVSLPEAVRPFCKLAGSTGDCVSLAFEGETLPELTPADKETIEMATGANPKLPRVSSDTVLSAMIN